MKHRDKIGSLIEQDIKRRKVMKMSRFIIEVEKRRFCQEALKIAEEKNNKKDHLFQDDQFMYQNAKRAKDYLTIVAAHKQTTQIFQFKQFIRQENFENEKQILHFFKQNEQNPFFDLVSVDNQRMLLKKYSGRYSLIDYAYSIKHDWEEFELIFIYEKLLRICQLLKKEGVYLGDYHLENIILEEISRDSGRYNLKIADADKAVSKNGLLSYSLENKLYINPILFQKPIFLSANQMEACDIWSIIRCIALLICGIDDSLYTNNYNSMILFLEEQVKCRYPLLYVLLNEGLNLSEILLQQSQNSVIFHTINQQKQNNEFAKPRIPSFESIVEDIERLSHQKKVKKIKWLENKILKQCPPLSKYSEQIDLYQFLMKVNLFENAVDTLERILQESNSIHEREVLILNLDHMYCLYKTGMRYKGETRLNDLKKCFMKYIQYDFEMLYKYTLTCIVYGKENIKELFAIFPHILSLKSDQSICHHYLFYLLQCQQALKYFEQGKLQLGLMQNQIAIDYAYDNIVNNRRYIFNIQKAQSEQNTSPIISLGDSFIEQRDTIFDALTEEQGVNDGDYYSKIIQEKLTQLNLGVCENNSNLIGQYLLIMEEYDLAINKITDLQTKASCLFYQEKYESAIQVYEGLKDMKHFQKDPTIYLALVLCYYLIQDYEKAYSNCQKANQICEKYEQQLLNLDKDQDSSTTQYTQGEEQMHREYQAKLLKRKTQNLQNQNNDTIQKNKRNKYEKQYLQAFQQYNFKISIIALKGFCEIEIDKIDSAFDNMKYAIDYFERNGLFYEKADMLENIAFVYFKLGFSSSSSKKSQETALEGYNQKIKLNQSTINVNIEIDIPDSLNIISLSFMYSNDLKIAIKYAEQVLNHLQVSSQTAKEFQFNDEWLQNENTIENREFHELVWKQYFYLAILFDNAENYENSISCTQKTLQMIQQLPKTIQNIDYETQIYLLIAQVHKNMFLFEEALKYFVKASDLAQKIGSQKNISDRLALLNIQCLSFALSIYTSESYNSQPTNGKWCAQKMECVLQALSPQKYVLLPKYYLQLSQYLDLINNTSHAIEIAKTATLLHQDIFSNENKLPQNELKTKTIIYNTLIKMLESQKRFKEAESYIQELKKFT